MSEKDRHFGRRAHAALRLEQLEERIAPAGVIVATARGGNLTITGDDGDNSIVIDNTGLAGGEIHIVGLDGTTINGQAEVILQGVTKGINARLGDGADTLRFDGLVGSFKLAVDGGRGNDAFTLDNNADITGTLSLKGGNDNDSLTVANAMLSGELKWDGGNGDSALSFSTVNLGKLSVKNITGLDTLTYTTGTVAGAFSINNGKGGSSTTLTGIDSGALKLANADGNDTVTFGALTSDEALSIADGNGDSTIMISNSTLTGKTVSIKNLTGNDAVTIQDSVILGALSVSNGNGDAETDIFTSTIGIGAPGIRPADVKIANGNGFHGVWLVSVTTGKGVFISGGNGGSEFDSEALDVGGDFSYRQKGGLDSVFVFDADIQGKTTVDTGGDSDAVSFDGVHLFGPLTVKMGTGNDFLFLDAQDNPAGPTSVFDGKVTVDMGAGDDDINVGTIGEAGNQAVYGAAVLFNGGSGDDDVDIVGNGNTFAVDPVFKGIEDVF